MSAMCNPRFGGWIQTFSGVAFYPLDPRIEEIRIEDIAHALAGDFRFGGHLRARYSVAQHSFHVSELVPGCFALKGLLHDASEAYLRDIPRPIKQLPEMKPYRDAEAWLQALIYSKFTEDCTDYRENQLEARMRVELMSEGFADPRRKPITIAFPTSRFQKTVISSGFRPAA